MKNYIYLLFVVIIFDLRVAAQTDNADCMNVVTIDEGSTHLSSKGGVGQLIEISDKDTKSLYSFGKEENTFWYKFILPENAEVSFTILPDNPKNDFDFLVFEATNEDICELIKDKKIIPIRTNIARRAADKNGATGVSKDALAEYVHSGPGDNFSKNWKGKASNEYYLVINCPDSDHSYGHKINLSYKKEPKKIVVSQKKEEVLVEVKKEPSVSLNVSVFDNKIGQPIDVTLEVDGIIPGKPIIEENKNHFTYILEKRKIYNVRCIYKGFLMYSENIDITDHTEEQFNLKIKLAPIEDGAKFSLNDIKFKPDGAYILRSSEPELKGLYQFMIKNPTTEIQINGHVNAPYMKNTAAAQKLSKNRAKAVYEYLIKAGIKKSRLNYKGFGNTQMIYPTPHSYSQERANRRVEILVLRK